jgi:L-ascorbate metabolism protein UlaG (beta-lactamase superfamily)
MILEYLAHSCFLCQDSLTSLILDPYAQALGYKLPIRSADYILISHWHKDHSDLSGVKGKAVVISGAGRHKAGNLEINGIVAEHDSCGGKLYGYVVLYTFILDSLKFCHLSDLGCKLKPEQIKAIGAVDVLFLPVGGTFTLDSLTAQVVMEQLKPKITIPMHYLTPTLNRSLYPLQSREKFLQLCSKVKIIRDSVVKLSKDDLPETSEVWALNSTF